MADSPLAIHQQGEDTARIAEYLAGLLCSFLFNKFAARILLAVSLAKGTVAPGGTRALLL